MMWNLLHQILFLFVLGIPIACIVWTVTHEEVFREPREYCIRGSKERKTIWERKFFYLFTCEYCFSHYITLFFLLITGYKLLFDDWRGYIIAFFSLVWIANWYMSLFALLRMKIKEETTEIVVMQEELKKL